MLRGVAFASALTHLILASHCPHHSQPPGPRPCLDKPNTPVVTGTVSVSAQHSGAADDEFFGNGPLVYWCIQLHPSKDQRHLEARMKMWALEKTFWSVQYAESQIVQHSTPGSGNYNPDAAA